MRGCRLSASSAQSSSWPSAGHPGIGWYIKNPNVSSASRQAQDTSVSKVRYSSSSSCSMGIVGCGRSSMSPTMSTQRWNVR